MGDTKRQHYAPRFYLSRFASPDGFLRAYDKLKGQRIPPPVHVMAVAQSTKFYDFPDAVHGNIAAAVARGDLPQDDEGLMAKATDRQMIEHHLGDLEGHFASVLRSLLDAIDQGAGIDPVHRRNIAHFLCVQRMRTPGRRAQLLGDVKAAESGDVVMISGEPHTFSLSPVDANLERVVHAYAFTSPEVLTPAIEELTGPEVLTPAIEELTGEVWLIGRNDTASQLYTSDDPVVMLDTTSDQASGFPLNGTRLLFPLTPQLLLLVVRQEAMPERAPMSLGEFSMTDELVTAANKLQVINCTRHVFCRDDQFDLAEAVALALRPHP